MRPSKVGGAGGADDLSGAAELAGAAHERGLRAVVRRHGGGFGQHTPTAYLSVLAPHKVAAGVTAAFGSPLGGVLFAARTKAEVGSTYGMGTFYVNLRARLAAEAAGCAFEWANQFF